MDYFHQLQTAVTYIEEHLAEDIIPGDIAEQAGYSLFHFCRIFQGIAGESVMEYVRNRRLTKAACALVRSNRRILDIALDYAYESQAAFTRSFKRAYGVTPGRYRRQGKYMPLRVPLILASPGSQGESMEPTIVNLDAFIVVGLEYVGKNENGEIPALWDQYNARCGEVRHKTVPEAYLGVCGEMRSDGSYSYTAGARVTTAADVPVGMVAKVVPAAKYAVFTHRGPLFGVEKDLQSTYQYIYGEWLPKSEYDRADTPDFELYDERFADGQATSEMDIYIPLK
ncbi:MAG TPA: AraC family transcriptional regulator [Armatimonadota bacterium]|nr:AraC family transcriptional regulator [Armatimonadota bacterium]